MKKKTLVTCFMTGWICFIIPIVGFVVILMVVPQSACVPMPLNDAICTDPFLGQLFSWVCGLFFFSFVLGWMLLTTSWIAVLAKQAQQQQWTWFVCTLLFGWLAASLYVETLPKTPQPVPPASAPGDQSAMPFSDVSAPDAAPSAAMPMPDATPPADVPTPQPEQAKKTRKIALSIVGIFLLLVGGACGAIFFAWGQAEQNNSAQRNATATADQATENQEQE